MNIEQFVEFFRNSSPYIHSLRGKTVVVLLTDDSLRGDIDNLVADLALLASLGIRLVIVQGGRAQIAHALDENQYYQGIRVTDTEALDAAVAVSGKLRFAIEAAFSRSLINSPMFNSEMRVVSGNYVYARPIGVINGVDFLYSGKVRQVHNKAIADQLKRNNIVLLSHIGVSVTGELFNVEAGEVAVAAAQSLNADKLIIVGDDIQCRPENGRELTALQARQRLTSLDINTTGRQTLQTLCRACDAAIPRVQVVNSQVDGGILAELYTRDGVGTMVSQDNYDQLRQANLSDIGGILALLQPLEEKGILVPRSRQRLETEISEYYVFERDGLVIGCAALHPFDDMAELACLVIHPNYRGQHRAQSLLQEVEKQALAMGCHGLFILTTQTAHWFVERGFIKATKEQLPEARRQKLDANRNSQVYIKALR
ncbi:amino-acid N-acetyltransferase [Salinibius halmophilus]|uniref:amino-acid N-acetyltransferase n=1 Tax=Salinibius halmophilus TaxID=1853216 RepID=UPI000E66CBDE|nr:amino-acid N-acetyltransferase [Salinibius halmophilus]